MGTKDFDPSFGNLSSRIPIVTREGIQQILNSKPKIDHAKRAKEIAAEWEKNNIHVSGFSAVDDT